MKLIGLLGSMGAGKTTAATILARAHNLDIVSVAAPIRAMLQALGVDPALFNGRHKDKPIAYLGNKTPRQLMQSLGDWGREDVAGNVWSGLLETRLAERHLANDLHVVVDDIRLPLEAAAIRARGGVLWRVIRGTQQVQAIGSHVTERGALIEADQTIPNHASIADLEHALAEAWADQYEEAQQWG